MGSFSKPVAKCYGVRDLRNSWPIRKYVKKKIEGGFCIKVVRSVDSIAYMQFS
jgi:hypothetical protein